MNDVIRAAAIQVRDSISRDNGGLAAWEINGGYCDEFAEKLYRRLKAKGIQSKVWFTRLHSYVEAGGKFYDAEMTRGAHTPYSLPVFRRDSPLAVRMAVLSAEDVTPHGHNG